MNSCFRDDVGVEAVAEVDRVDVVAGAKFSICEKRGATRESAGDLGV